MSVTRLVFPALRWDAEEGFGPAEVEGRRALAGGAGGFILFGGTLSEVQGLTARLRALAPYPILVAADLERGAGQQVQGLRELPPPLALGALGDLTLVEAAGAITGWDARLAGIDWVLAPVADLDAEPANPIVQTRAFGNVPERVAACVTAWVRGCQTHALATVKHFPGHGRTVVDSHTTLPVVTADRETLLADLAPFDAAIAHGVDAVMTCHVAFPALDPSGAPATFSPNLLAMLRTRGFSGLVVSDALMMGGAAGTAPAVAACEAVRAGVDILLYPEDAIGVMRAVAAEAARDAAFRARCEAGLARLDRAIAEAAARREAPVPADPGIPDRLLATCPPLPSLVAPLELVTVDDDLEGTYPPAPSRYVADALARDGVSLGAGGSRVVLLLAEPRAGKGRAGLGETARAALRRTAPGAALVVVFGHPRLLRDVPEGVPTVIAWHRQRAMQEALAHLLRRQIR